MARVVVKIDSEADLSASVKTGEEFQRLYTHAEKLREAFGKLSSVTGKSAADSAAFFQEVAKGQGDTKALADATEKLTLAKKDLKSILKELSHAIPGFHAGILFLRHPLTLAAGAVTLLISAFRNYVTTLDQVEGKLDVHAAIGRTVAAMASASAQAASELGAFNAQLADMATKSDNAAGGLNKVLGAIQRLDAQEGERRDAQEGLALAKINADEQAGKIGPADAITRRAAVKSRFDAQRQAAQVARQQEEQDARKDALRREMEGRVAAEQALPGATQDAIAKERAAKTAGETFTSDHAAIQAEQEEIDKQLKSLSRQRGGFQMGVLEAFAAIAPKGSAAARAPAAMRADIDRQIDALTARRAKLDAHGRIATDKRDRATAGAKTARDRVTAIEGAITAGRGREGALFNDVIEGNQNIEQSRWHEGQVGGLRGQTDKLNTNTARLVAEAREAKAHAAAMEALVREIFSGMKIQRSELDAMRQQIRSANGR